MDTEVFFSLQKYRGEKMAKKDEKLNKNSNKTKEKKQEVTKVKKAKPKKEKTKKVKKENYFEGVKSELGKVKWPTKQEVFKYTMATIGFVVVLVLFFVLMSLIMSLIKGAFN